MARPKFYSVYAPDISGTIDKNDDKALLNMPVSAPYNPYSQYAESARFAADSQYNNALAQADYARQQSIADAQNAYRNARPTYGANAERYLAAGLTGSGLSDYAQSSAYAAMRGEIANANAVNAYAQQTALYNRDQAYAQADAYKAQVEQTLYNNLLSSVMSGNLSAEMVEPVASAYGLANSNAVIPLKNAAVMIAEQQKKLLKEQTDKYEEAYKSILDNGITDAETADKVARGAGYSEDSDAYASILSAAEQNAERQKTISEAGKVAWNADKIGAAIFNDNFTLNIGGKEYELKTKTGKQNVVKDQGIIDRLNEMATGDKAKTPTVQTGKMDSTTNAGAIQVLDGKMYLYHPRSNAWREVQNSAEAVKAWNDASLKGRFAYYNAMTDAEKQKLIESAFDNENTKVGLDALAEELKSAGVSEEVINKAMESRKSAYGNFVDSAIPTQYKGVPIDSAYKEHIEDLKDDMLTNEQKQKIREAYVKNQGLDGLLAIYDAQIRSKVSGDADSIQKAFAALGYTITYAQASDISKLRKNTVQGAQIRIAY